MLFFCAREGHFDQSAAFPFPVSPAPRRRWLAGVLVSSAGYFLLYLALACTATALAFGFVLPAALFIDPGVFALLLLSTPVVVLGAAGLPASADLVRYGRRMRAADALTVLAKDRRAPVLYLRSFNDDDLPDMTFRGGSRNPLIPQRYEEKIVSVLDRIGPVISIGIPGERRGELGAARLYVSDEQWRAAVEFFVRSSAAVIIVIGRTPALWWEIDLALSNARGERLLFFFPQTEEPSARQTFWRRCFQIIPTVIPGPVYRRIEAERQARYDLFREKTRGQIVGRLPERLGDALFLDFTERHLPRLLPTKRPFKALFYFYMRRSVSRHGKDVAPVRR